MELDYGTLTSEILKNLRLVAKIVTQLERQEFETVSEKSNLIVFNQI